MVLTIVIHGIRFGLESNVVEELLWDELDNKNFFILQVLFQTNASIEIAESARKDQMAIVHMRASRTFRTKG